MSKNVMTCFFLEISQRSSKRCAEKYLRWNKYRKTSSWRLQWYLIHTRAHQSDSVRRLLVYRKSGSKRETPARGQVRPILRVVARQWTGVGGPGVARLRSNHHHPGYHCAAYLAAVEWWPRPKGDHPGPVVFTELSLWYLAEFLNCQ